MAWSKTWKVSVRAMTVVTLKNPELSNDDDGSENVAKKLNLPYFKMFSRLFGAAKFAEFVKCRRFLLEMNS